MDFMDTELQRIQDIRHAPTPDAYVKQRIQIAAEQLSNAARIQGTIEVVNESLTKLASILYDTVERQPVNFDVRTYRILIPLPWGDGGYKKWQMRAVEARILRSILITRCNADPTGILYAYGDHRWYVNAKIYRNTNQALTYLHENPISAREWLRHANAWHDRELQRFHASKKS